MKQETTYLIGEIGTITCIASVVCGIAGIKIWSTETNTILAIMLVVFFGIGSPLILCPFIFGHIPISRKKIRNLEIPYYQKSHH